MKYLAFILLVLPLLTHASGALVGSTPVGSTIVSSTTVSSAPVSNRREKLDLMEEIVVTATRSERILRTNPYSIGVITDEQLKLSTYDQVADLVAKIPGILISDSGQAGQKRIRIRGEDARRIALLIDNQEFIDHREVGVPMLVDVNRIQRIEVVRGPASVLYGPKAMGGVINIITEKEFDRPFELTANSTYNSATDGYTVGVGLGGAGQNINWALGGFVNDQGLRDTPEGELERTDYDSQGFNANISYLKDAHKFGAGYENYESESAVYVEPEVRFTPPFRDFIIDAPQRDREKLRLDYRYSPAGQHLQTVSIDGYRQKSEREFNTFPFMTLGPGLDVDTSILTTSELITDGVNLQSDWQLSDSLSLITGLQWLEDDIEQDRVRTVVTNGEFTSSEIQSDEATLATLAWYGQAEYDISERLSILTGLRTYDVDGELSQSNHFADLPDFNDNHTIGSLAFVYESSETSTFRATYSEGYIFPSLFNLVVGAYAGSSFINPVPTLSPETSDTIELGYRYAGATWSLDTVMFYTQAEDYIDHVPCLVSDACPGSRDRIYKNIGESNSHGIELGAHYQTGNLNYNLGLTWMQREKVYEGVETWDSGVPQLAGFLSASYVRSIARRPLTSTITVRFESDTDELIATRRGSTLETNPGYGVVDLDFHYQPSDKVSLSFVTANITDKKYHSATENLYAAGRHVRFKISFSI
jgi:hemoglobin/transferrin/lactoferrin receptor protein